MLLSFPPCVGCHCAPFWGVLAANQTGVRSREKDKQRAVGKQTALEYLGHKTAEGFRVTEA